MNQTQTFYDELAESYQYIFTDWNNSVRRQSESLSSFLTELGYSPSAHILDCTCGIGTQAIALALAGYKVDARDLSPQSIAQAQQHASTFDLSESISFGVADLLSPPKTSAQYDITLAFDNPIAHFQDDETLSQAFHHMIEQTKDGGLIATSLRDYDQLCNEQPRQSHIRVRDLATGRRIMFQVWDWWENGLGYDSQMFVINQTDAGWHTESYPTQMRAWLRDDVTRILESLGLDDIQWHMPETSGFYQPIMTARK